MSVALKVQILCASARSRQIAWSMSRFNVYDHTILLTRTGSRAYGIHTPESDLDTFEAVCVRRRSASSRHLM